MSRLCGNTVKELKVVRERGSERAARGRHWDGILQTRYDLDRKNDGEQSMEDLSLHILIYKSLNLWGSIF